MASSSRPEPMNASPHHPKVRVTCTLSDPLYVAGGFIAGKMEVECKTDKGLGLGLIMAELSAVEELTSRDHSATSTFYHTRRLFQGPGLPPSNSVHAHPPPGAPPLPTNCYYARKGMTTFLFRFPVPPSCPSSINFGSGLATIKYEVRATVGVAYKGENKLVFDKKDVDIVETFEPDFSRVDPEAVVVGESGKIWLQAKLLGGVVVAGQPACVELTVRNHSSKKNTSLNLSLSRHLHFPNVPPSQKAPFQISDTLITVPFRGPDYVIHPGTEGVASLVFDAPKNSRGVKGSQRPGNEDSTKQLPPLFEVKCNITIMMSMGFGSKDLVVDIPVTILHHKALPTLLQGLEPPQPPVQYQPVYDPPYVPMTPIPIMYTGRTGSPYDYVPPQPLMSPHPGLPYVDHGNIWLPYGVIPQQVSYYPQPTQQYYYPPPQSSLIPLYTGNGIHPIRPSSTEPAPSQPLYSFDEVPLYAQQVQEPLHFSVTPESQQYYAVGDVETEEGKGERAERVSRQLRMSMRARSSSPSHHRFPIYPSSAPAQHLFGSPPPDRPISPNSPPITRKPSVHLTLQNLPPPLVQQHTGGSGELHSPRPVLSPKASFTVDPLTNEIRGTIKDEMVENLEKMAEEAIRENSNMSGSGGLNADPATGNSPGNQLPEIEKPLPLPPPPVEEPSRVDGLFLSSPLGSEEEELTPKTPTLTATTPFRLGRSMYRHLNALDSGRSGGVTSGPSGLDALEARLIAEVGTRRLDKDDVKPDVRSVLAMPIDIPTLRGRTAGQVGGHARSPGEKNASVSTHGILEDINDSAISSLTLAGEGKSPVANALRYEEAGGGGPKTLRVGRDATHDRLDYFVEGSVEKVQTPRNRERERKSSTGKKSTGSGYKEGGKGEGRKKRKAAVGRVADWLGKIDPYVPPPQVDTPPPISPLPGAEPLHPSDAMLSPVFTPGSPEISSKSPLPEAEPSKTPVLSRNPPMDWEEMNAEAGCEVSAPPNPRSSGFMPIHSIKLSESPSHGKEDVASTPKPPSVQVPWMQKLEAAKSSSTDLKYVPRFRKNTIPSDLTAKYDVRSARGGRGGQVTAVAAIWAASEKDSALDFPTPKPWTSPNAPGNAIAGPKSTKPTVAPRPGGLSATKPSATGLALRKIDVGKVKSTQSVSGSGAGQEEDGEETPVKGSNHTRARMIKSSSVPAVISSSTAVPMISSTASLVRPPGSSPVRERPGKISRGLGTRIPTIEEDIASDSTSVGVGRTRGGGVVESPSKTELAFGQARLRDLIKKYQG
ncbi:hypothetical protein BJ322DRAFT_382751 [Thelephora terrestris]|uniref:Arrestin C-terminal-like domain-containing protein n=1 Tax=Thelephora terrestris TaxID=56493 RepID=A0A9P6LB48_9AGAM|nr:hypothetical protein BJ322DRAFT_382751 [Thelephora terrestris]